jgi:Protein of unknown function (DUF3054)
MRIGNVAPAVALDCCGVLAFVIIGRHTHHDGDSEAGIWQTAWPFLAGLALGIVAGRGWRRPLAIVPAGLAAWLGAAVAGMAIRVLAGQGTAAAFIVVTLAFLGLFLLGWRLLAWAVATRRPASGQCSGPGKPGRGPAGGSGRRSLSGRCQGL